MNGAAKHGCVTRSVDAQSVRPGKTRKGQACCGNLSIIDRSAKIGIIKKNTAPVQSNCTETESAYRVSSKINFPLLSIVRTCAPHVRSASKISFQPQLQLSLET